MKVFLDTNVLLDTFLDNRPYFQEASAILSACEFGVIEGFVSYLSLANIAYILRKDLSLEQIKIVLRKTSSIVNVLPMDIEQMERAFDVVVPDFEDVLQYECAKSFGCSIIVTANTKHFKFCTDIDVCATSEYAHQFAL